MRSPVRLPIAGLLAGAALAGCAGGGGPAPPSAGSPAGGAMVSDTPVLIGAPYTIGDRTYTPTDPDHYDEVGYASFYGEGHDGRPTANGEAFRPEGVSAAHRTLPLPSYVEVTSLDTGQTILVRVNDRGPFGENRIIDLSLGAARLLGIENQGVAPVRVRRVHPAEADRARLRVGQAAPARLTSSEQLLEALRARLARGGGIIPAAAPPPGASGRADTVAVAPPDAAGRIDTVPVPPPVERSEPARQVAPEPATPPATGDHFVQLGAFSNAGNARRLADRARSLGTVRIVEGGGLNRVRLGPFPDSRAAESALARVRQAGFAEARIVRDSSR